MDKPQPGPVDPTQTEYRRMVRNGLTYTCKKGEEYHVPPLPIGDVTGPEAEMYLPTPADLGAVLRTGHYVVTPDPARVPAEKEKE